MPFFGTLPAKRRCRSGFDRHLVEKSSIWNGDHGLLTG
jgi:hypothetical protein